MIQKNSLLACGVCLLASEELALVVPGTLLLAAAASLPDVCEKMFAWGSGPKEYQRHGNTARKR